MKRQELREAVRKRPGMYVGGTDGFGVAQLVLEVLSNAVDQHLVERCFRVDVRVDADSMVTPRCRPAVAAATREAMSTWTIAAPAAAARMRDRVEDDRRTRWARERGRATARRR
jgi:DNA gyrase/topoisomerase IV subunit B